MQKNIRLRTALGFLASVSFAACGGGGGSSSPTPPPVAGTPPPPVNSAPTFSSPSQASVMESDAAPFFTVEASDSDGDDVTLTLVPSSDSDGFAFNTNTGQLSGVTAFDYETPLDANGRFD